MSDLLTHPLWKSADLGRGLPESTHAVSVCLPTWADNVAYEEHDPRVHSVLTAGYPRFVYHPLCRQVFAEYERRFAGDGECCLIFGSPDGAARCVDFLNRQSGPGARTRDLNRGGLTAVILPESQSQPARACWQHLGEGLSSRAAEALLTEQTDIDEQAGRDAQRHIRDRIARTVTDSAAHRVAAPEVYLYPTGMAAIAAAHRAVTRLTPGARTVQFGFPYVDSLKLQEKWGTGCQFFPNGSDEDLDRLAALLSAEPVAAIFTETPSNPLLTTPDMERLTLLARAHNVPLVIDNTISSINCDLLPAADLLCTSLTKHFSGGGDVTGGSLVVNPQSRRAEELHQHLQDDYCDALWPADAVVLERNSREFVSRVQQMNSGAELLADELQQWDSVETVYYPQFQTPEHYLATRRGDGGYGSLLSLVFRERRRAVPFYDALRVCKGPNLGTNFTLACPFTILAHYEELDFVESCGVSRYLVRVSVGVEDPQDLVSRFREARDTADSAPLE